jgi:rRNA maturation RNase YbeY
MTSAPNIHFFFKEVAISLRRRTKLKAFIRHIFKNEGKKLQTLHYVFCNDKELIKINKTYLKHNFFTDIITFDLSETDHEITAETYISVERVRENAAVFGTSFKEELLRVIFHGALHLCDYKDKTKPEKARMRKREDFYLLAYLKSTI